MEEKGGHVTVEAVANALRADASLTLMREPQVTDVSGGCGQSFQIQIVSETFVGLRVVQRHRVVHAALAQLLPHVHALQLKCYTPEAFARTQADAEGSGKVDSEAGGS